MKSFEKKKRSVSQKMRRELEMALGNKKQEWKKQDDSKWIEMKADEAENPSFLLQRPKDSDQLEKNCTL